MGIAKTIKQQLASAQEAVNAALVQARNIAAEEIQRPLQDAVAAIENINRSADGTFDRWLEKIEQSRYTAFVVSGATLFTLGVGAFLGWMGRAIFG